MPATDRVPDCRLASWFAWVRQWNMWSGAIRTSPFPRRVVSATHGDHPSLNKRNIIIVGAVVMVGLIGVGAAAGGSSTADGATPSNGTTQPVSSSAPVAETTPAAPVESSTTPEADPDSGRKVGLNEATKVGDVTVTVLDAKISKGTQYQKPAKGHVFFAMNVRYEADDAGDPHQQQRLDGPRRRQTAGPVDLRHERQLGSDPVRSSHSPRARCPKVGSSSRCRRRSRRSSPGSTTTC